MVPSFLQIGLFFIFCVFRIQSILFFQKKGSRKEKSKSYQNFYTTSKGLFTWPIGSLSFRRPPPLGSLTAAFERHRFATRRFAPIRKQRDGLVSAREERAFGGTINNKRWWVGNVGWWFRFKSQKTWEVEGEMMFCILSFFDVILYYTLVLHLFHVIIHDSRWCFQICSNIFYTNSPPSWGKFIQRWRWATWLKHPPRKGGVKRLYNEPTRLRAGRIRWRLVLTKVWPWYRRQRNNVFFRICRCYV